MGLIHALRMQKLVADARASHARGDFTFCAGFDVDVRGITMRKIRKEIDLIIRSVEAVGWQCVGVEQFLASVEINFVRTN